MSNIRSSRAGACAAVVTVVGEVRTTGPARAVVVSVAVPAGFPSPAEDYYDGPIDLNRHLIPRPASTFVVRVSGWSMRDAGIWDGDELLVDRSEKEVDGRIVVAVVDGQFTVKRLRHRGGRPVLTAENPEYPDVTVTEDTTVWGVVRTVIHHV